MDKFAPRDELVFLPLGGSGEIGMNFNAYGFGPEGARQWIIVDCGVLFGREAQTPGVDILMPDIRYLAEQRGQRLHHFPEFALGAASETRGV